MANYNSSFTGAQIDAGIALANTAQQPPSEGAFVNGDKTKLDGIEALADVTDATNVQAAGALMDSEVTNLAAVKSFDPTDYATAAQGSTADSAVQPGDLATVATSGDYNDLTNKPTLGTAASTDSTAYATAAQGALADSATQPGDLATVATSGDYNDLTNKPTLGTAASTDSTAYATAAQGSLADSATQPGDNVSTLTNDAAYVPSDPTGVTGADAITNMMSLTQAEYDAIVSPDAATLYVIV